MALSWIPTKAQESQKQETDTTIVLEDITATAPMTRHLIDGDEYIITEQMRERSGNVAELLNLLPSVKVNRMDNSLSVENKNNVVLLVNGKRYSVDYIKSINPERIVGVKVIKKPTGRYVSEGYDAIIDLKVRSYDGIDLSASNFMILNFNNNGHDKVMMEQPSVSFTYTQNRFSVFGSYAHGLSKWNTPYDNALTVENSYQLDGHGMEKYRYHGNVANIGANYRLSDNHELSTELGFRKEYTSSDRSLTNQETMQTQSVMNDNTNPTYGATLFYKGRFGENLNVYSELSYSYLKNKVDNNFIEESQSYGTTIRENRYDIKYTLETEWKTSDWLSLKGGYRLGWKKYDSDNDFQYTDMRNKLWAYLTYNPSDALSLEAGAAVELEAIKQPHENSHNYFRILPTAKINYTPSSKLNFNLAYTANGDYPTLAMLNPAQTILNKEVYQRGNPSLKPEVSHSIALESRFFDMFSANLQFDYAKNHIASLATAESGNVIFTYSNTFLKRLTVPLNFEYPIGKYLNLSIDAAYYVSWGEIRGS